MSDSSEPNSQDEQSSESYQSSNSSDEETESSTNDVKMRSLSDNEETEYSSEEEGEEYSSDDYDNEGISEWDYYIPNRKLKLFNDNSNISNRNYSKFRPVEFFKLLFTEQLFQLICKQTNVYRQQRYGTHWIPVSMTDIMSWIGLNILMGYHKLPSYKHYWSSNLNFKVPIVSQTMSRNLFEKISSNIHLADNKKIPPKASPEYSKTYKVDEFLEILQKNFKQNYILDEYVSIDESMIKFKGRSSLKQYLPMKPTKRGFKMWALADSTNGYVYNFQIYKGRDPGRTTSLGEHVVRDLTKELEFSYRQVYFDNYFTTPNLLEYLYQKGIYAAGTIRVNRKNMPKDFCRSKKKMNHGDFEYITSNNLVLHKWMDRKLVFVLSNFHDPTSYDVIQRREKSGFRISVQCPTSIIDYNK